MAKGFLEGFLFKPQGGPMVYPYTMAARVSQFPWMYSWHECWHHRFMAISVAFVLFPMYYMINQKLTGPENKAYWREKRAADRAHHQHHMEKMWEIRT